MVVHSFTNIDKVCRAPPFEAMAYTGEKGEGAINKKCTDMNLAGYLDLVLSGFLA